MSLGMKNLGKAASLPLLMTLLAPGAARGQTSMGGVSGTVTDPTGAVVPGATVLLVNQATNVRNERLTNSAGFFTFVNVRPGTYVLTVELSGFNKAQIMPFTVDVNQTVARNVTLQVGAATETVEVTAQSELLQTTSAELGNVVEEKIIRDLPTQGRNFTQMLLLTPGVNPYSTAQGPKDSTTNGTEGNTGVPGAAFSNVSVQGQQNRSKLYYIDGIINTGVRSGTYVVLPDLDSLQEIKVQSHSDKAEFGGVLGGVVTMTSKSGANRLSGGAFGFFRNEGLQARDPFRDFNRDKAPDYRQAQFGVNVSGPIVKDKTFFFAGYDGWRYRNLPDLRYTLPAGAELDGDFSKSYGGRKIYNPFTTRIENGRVVRDPFPGNVIPANMISPTMQAFLKAYMPKPNVAGNIADNFLNSVGNRYQTSHGNTFQLRVDHHFSTRDNVFVRWTEQRISNFTPVGDVGFRTPDGINRNFGGGLSHTFSSSMILDVHGGLAAQPTEDAPLQHPLGVEPERSLALPELDRYAGWFATGFTGTSNSWNIPDLGQQGPRERNNPTWSVGTDLTWLRGKHNFKVGVQMIQLSRLQKNQFGQLNFSPAQTSDPQQSGTTGDALASALLGLPSGLQAFVPDATATTSTIDFHFRTYSGYVQDQWAIKKNLSLTYGVRYDYVGRAVGKGTQSGFDMSTGEFLIASGTMPPVCSAAAPPPCLPKPIDQIPFNQHIRVVAPFSIIKPIKDNVGPRVGLAWQVNPRTVVRTGYSLMWDALVNRGQYAQHEFERGWPLSPGISISELNRPGQDPNTRIEQLSNLPFAVPPASPWTLGGFFNDPDRKDPYSHQFHVEVQREVTRNLVTSVAYVGSRNGRLEYAGCATCATRPAYDGNRRMTPAERDQLRPYPYITGGFTYEQDNGFSSYDAFQFKLQHRFAHGLATVLSYTWSKTIDTSSGIALAENGNGGGAGVQNFFDIDSNKSVASYDIPHILTWAGVWELPAGPGKKWLTSGLASAILGNWQLNWNALVRSGAPFTPFVSGDPANVGVSNRTRPNLVGNPELDNPTVKRWFNVSAFAVPVNSFGDAGRNIVRGPGFWNVDLGLQRNFKLGAERRLELRFDAYNVFNHINRDLPSNAFVNIQDARAGEITGIAGYTRTMQVGLRVAY